MTQACWSYHRLEIVQAIAVADGGGDQPEELRMFVD